MRAIPVNLDNTLVSLNSSLVSLNSTPVSLSIVSLCGLRIGYIFIGLGISGLTMALMCQETLCLLPNSTL